MTDKHKSGSDDLGECVTQTPVPVVPSRFRRVVNRLWWLHSFIALGFGIGVMAFARKGLAYAETILIVLSLSWLLVFVAFRVIVGARNRTPANNLAKRGLRLFTNYIIKQLYQQKFFFLIPLYAASATWSVTSFNWWLPVLLLIGGILSTMGHRIAQFTDLGGLVAMTRVAMTRSAFLG